MKAQRIYKSLTALSLDGHAAGGADAPTPNATQAELASATSFRQDTPEATDFRAMLAERHSAPLVLAAPYRHWGINE